MSLVNVLRSNVIFQSSFSDAVKRLPVAFGVGKFTSLLPIGLLVATAMPRWSW